VSDHVDVLLDALRARKWRIAVANSPIPVAEALVKKYGPLPADYSVFLSRIATCVDPTETVWFLTCDEFLGRTDAAFKWNEFELQSLEAAAGDPLWTAEVRAFWSTHLPILISVKSGYAFMALKITDGTVVLGREPDYEEIEPVSGSFAELCRVLGHTAASLSNALAGIL
jgi:hypothetical protein